MFNKNIVIAAFASSVLLTSITTYAKEGCINTIYGCISNDSAAIIDQANYQAANHQATYIDDYAENSYASSMPYKPKDGGGRHYFYKNGKLYMKYNGKLYVYQSGSGGSSGTLPSNPFENKSFAQKGPVHPNGTFIFDPNKNGWAAYDASGNLIKTGRASGGQHFCYDVGRGCKTPAGSFRVYSKGSAACKSNTYPLDNPGAPMPYCMFFTGGYAIHGSYDVPNYNASHGCIRVHPSAAAWLSGSFMKIGTKVIVKGY